MAFTENLRILITADGAQAMTAMKGVGSTADKELGKAESRAASMRAGFVSAGTGMMAASAVMVAGLYQAGKAAADLEQAVGGTEAVFHDQAGAIEEFVSNSADLVGMSETAARVLTTQLGGALKGLGFSTQDAADQAINLTQVGADLAATYGGTTEEAVHALGRAFAGEFDPIQRWIPAMRQSVIDAKAVEMGLAKTTSEVDANARAQATLAVITEQTTDATGQFGREADTVAGQMARSQANLENAKAALGEGFMPVMAKGAEVASTLATSFKGADDATNGLLSTFVAVTAVGTGVVGAVSVLIGKLGQAKDKMKELRESTIQWSATKTNVAAFGIGIVSVAAVAATLWSELEKINAAAKEMGDSFTVMGKDKALEGGISRTRDQLEEMYHQMDILEGHVNQWEGTNNPFEKIAGAMERDANAALYNEIEKSATELEAFEAKVQSLMAIEGLSEETAVRYAMGLEMAGDESDEAAGRTEALKSITEEVAGAFDKAKSSLSQFVDKLHGTQNAEAEAEKALRDLIDAQADNQLSTSTATEAGYDNLKLIQDLQSAALAYGAEVYRETGSVDAATAAAREYLNSAQQAMLARYGNTTAVQGLNAEIAMTPEQVHTAFSQSGLDEIIGKMREFSKLTIQSVQGAYSSLGVKLAASIAGFDEGGVVPGPRGAPQLAMVHGGETILPTHKTGGGGTTAGGTLTAVFNVDGRELSRVLVDLERGR